MATVNLIVIIVASAVELGLISALIYVIIRGIRFLALVERAAKKYLQEDNR